MRPLLVLAAFAAVAGLPCALGCGMTTHDLIAHRAMQHFYSDAFGGKYEAIIAGNVDAVQGGAPFPGALLRCMGFALHFVTFTARVML